MEINRAPKDTVDIGNTPSVTLDEPIDVSIYSPLDDQTEAVLTVDYPHHEVHEGSHFTYSATNGNLDTAEVLEVLVVNPDVETYTHMQVAVYGALHTRFEMYEATTHTTDVQQAVFNNNRNSVKTPGVTVFTSNDDVADGTLIFETEFGIDTGAGTNKKSGGGEARGESEWILKRDTKYIFRIESQTDDNVVSMVLSWYEHTGI